MIKKVILAAMMIVCFLFTGCEEVVEEEYIFSLSDEQQQTYEEIIENTMNGFYWYYDDDSLDYFETTVPEYTDENLQMFEASSENGYDMKKYEGKNGVCYTADLSHFNGEKAGVVYFYFVKDDLCGLFYTPEVNGGVYAGLDHRNVYYEGSNITKAESDEGYTGEFEKFKLNFLEEGFNSVYLYENGSFIAETKPEGVTVYKADDSGIRKNKILTRDDFGGLSAVSSVFTNDGGLVVIVGTEIEGVEDIEENRILSGKVMFFDKNFEKEEKEIALSAGSYSCVSMFNENLVLINDKTLSIYDISSDDIKKVSSFYMNIQAVDFKEADIDNDGIKEAIITDNSDIYMYRINENGIIPLWRTNVSGGFLYGNIYTEDLNADGTDEVYICDSTGTVIRYVLGKHGLESRNDDILYSQRIYAADFNNDKKGDYILSDGENASLFMRK